MSARMTTDADDQSKGSKRLNHLLLTARGAFMTHGYQHVSVDGIARLSGVSKETIYRHFGDKQDLFRAAMKGATEEFTQGFADLFHRGGSPETVLARCARFIYDRSADTEHPTPNWLAVGTATHFPELSRAVFFDAVEGVSTLRTYLQKVACEKGVATEVSLDILAQFGGLASAGSLHLMGGAPLSETERDIAARRTAQLFLHGCAANLRDAAKLASPHREFALEATAPAPPQESHIAHLMQVARAHFYEHGYRGASLDEIGSVARVGRGTLYRHFGNKKGLFEATMVQAASEIMANTQLGLATDQPIAANLHAAAMAVSGAMQSPEGIRLYRTVSAEAKTMQDVAMQVYDLTRVKLAQPIADYLRWCSAHGLLRIEDPDWAAAQFITLATGGNRYLVLDPHPEEADRAALAELAISTFLYGYLGKRNPSNGQQSQN